MELNQFRDVDLVIDKANDNFIQRQFVSQGDYKGRTMTVQVTDNGLIGKVIGLTLNLRWQNQASGLADLTAFECIDEENSIFRIEYPEHMMTPGKVVANIQVIQNGKVTHLKSFELTVQKLAGEMTGIVEKAEYGALVAVLSDANKFRTDIERLGMDKADKTALAETDAEVAELDSTKADKTALANTNQQVSGLASNKVDKGGASQVTMGMLSQEVKTAMTGGSVAVVGKDAVSTTNIVDRSVTLNKVTRNLAFPTIGLGNGVPNYDTATKTLTFNAGNSFDTISWGDSVNRINLPQTGTQVSHSFGGHTIKLIINVDTKVLSFIAYSTVLQANESCLLTMEAHGKTVSSSFPITVNKKSPVPPNQLSRIGYLPTMHNSPVRIDAEACKMYFDGYDNWLFHAYDRFKVAIPYGGLELSIPTQTEIVNTAIYLLFDTVTGEFVWSSFNNVSYSPDFAIVGFVRRYTDSDGRLTGFNADFPFPWTFQGRLYGLEAADAGYTKSYQEKATNEIKCILHRGWNKRTPENTLRAYKEAKKRGFDMVECDISWTSDNEPVLLHDLTINRTARNDDGTTIADITNIADITLEQAKTYDFGIWQGAEFKGERIPTFREFLILCKQLDMYPYIEIKTVATTEQIQILADTVTDVGLTNFAWISGITQITMMSALRPDDDFGWVTTLTDIPDSDLALWAAFKTSKNRVFIDGELTKMSAELVGKVQAAGLEAEGWSAQTTAQVREFLAYGLTGISTDNVSVIEALVE